MTDKSFPQPVHGGPAFPFYAGEECFGIGMTLRDYFAARASEADVGHWRMGPICLQIRENSDGSKYEHHGPMEFTREQARYRFADAMLAARNPIPSQDTEK